MKIQIKLNKNLYILGSGFKPLNSYLSFLKNYKPWEIVSKNMSNYISHFLLLDAHYLTGWKICIKFVLKNIKLPSEIICTCAFL